MFAGTSGGTFATFPGTHGGYTQLGGAGPRGQAPGSPGPMMGPGPGAAGYGSPARQSAVPQGLAGPSPPCCPTGVDHLFCEPAGSVSSTDWKFVGQGRGSYEASPTYAYVGEGVGSYMPQQAASSSSGSRCCRTECVCLLCCALVACLLGCGLLFGAFDVVDVQPFSTATTTAALEGPPPPPLAGVDGNVSTTALFGLQVNTATDTATNDTLYGNEAPDSDAQPAAALEGAGVEGNVSTTAFGANVTMATTTLYGGLCSDVGRNCNVTKCCNDNGLECYRKDEFWATCRGRCKEGVDLTEDHDPQFQTPWSCAVLGGDLSKGPADGGVPLPPVPSAPPPVEDALNETAAPTPDALADRDAHPGNSSADNATDAAPDTIADASSNTTVTEATTTQKAGGMVATTQDATTTTTQEATTTTQEATTTTQEATTKREATATQEATTTQEAGGKVANTTQEGRGKVANTTQKAGGKVVTTTLGAGTEETTTTQEADDSERASGTDEEPSQPHWEFDHGTWNYVKS